MSTATGLDLRAFIEAADPSIELTPWQKHLLNSLPTFKAEVAFGGEDEFGVTLMRVLSFKRGPSTRARLRRMHTAYSRRRA